MALTGATGFVGRRVMQKLLDNGYRVKALVRPQSLHKAIQSDHINWIEGELGNEASHVALTFGADIVIHMAGVVTARTKDAYYALNAEAVGSLALAANTAGVKRFVYLSSLAARAPHLSDYAGSKRAGEGRLSRKLGKMKGVCVRAPAVFGAGDKATAPFYALIRKGFLPCPGGRHWKKRVISLIQVDDLADFLIGPGLSGGHDGKTISISTRARINWSEFADACSEASGKPVKVLPLPLSVLYAVSAVTSVTKRVFGKGHLTLGKLREFLYDDWSIDADLQTGTDLCSVLRKTIYEE